MRLPRAYAIAIVGATFLALAACGGGGPGSSSADASGSSSGSSSGNSDNSGGSSDPIDTPVSTPVVGAICDSVGNSNAGPAVPVGDTVTRITVSNHSTSGSRSDVPITFGQPFAPGDLPDGAHLVGRTASGTTVPVQMDVKAHHCDGSIRHAVLSARVPASDSGDVLQIVRSDNGPAGAAPGLSDLIASGFDATVSITENGTTYTASAADLLQASTPRLWLDGPVAREWLVAGRLTDGTGAPHPLLHARFYVRAYKGLDHVRVAVVLENTWAYASNPHNVTYDVDVTVDGKTVLSQADVTHYAHARWRRVFWAGGGGDPRVHVAHDIPYLLATRAVPNYDPSITVPESVLASMDSAWSGNATALMHIGPYVTAHMGDTGAQPAIGPLPRWSARYLMSMDAGAKRVALGIGSQAGTWSIHYRDASTGLPVSLDDHPYMTLLGNQSDTINPSTGESDGFPSCSPCNSPYDPDSAHQPSLAYLPYLLTGDYYFLEELQFWANWNMLRANPNYRGHEKGLVKWQQTRGQGWSLRKLGRTAFITPDDNPLKSYFLDKLRQNRLWYANAYVDGNGTYANSLGWVGATLDANGEPTRIAPWMDDFITWAVGDVVELGFENWRPFLEYKARFPVGRITASGYCWLNAAPYRAEVRSSSTAPFFGTFAGMYQATFGTSPDSDCAGGSGEMTGYPGSPTGYPSNLQPALAVAADSGIANAANAWSVFDGRTVKPGTDGTPDYNTDPQFAIVPR